MTKKLPEGFCILPFVHMEIQIQGQVHVCCHTNQPQDMGNLHQQDLQSVWQGDQLKDFKRHILSAQTQKNSHCKDCFYYESLGAKSWRQYENENWSLYIDDVLAGRAPSQPKSLSLRFSNLCNFSCRTCRPATSTGWFKDALFLNPHGQYHKVTSTPSNKSMLSQIEPYLKGLTQIHFVGGEPLMESEHYDILERLASVNPDIEITYDTNLSILSLGDREVIPLWNQFKKVNLSASIDGLGEKGEFIRKGLDWNSFLKNWNRVKEEAPHVRLMNNFTLSVYNMFHVLEFIEFIHESDFYHGQDLKDFSVTLVEEPKWQSLQILPPDLKKELRRRYQNFPLRHMGRVAEDLDNAISYMEGADQSQLLGIFRNFNKKLDLIRAENFSKLFREEAQCLGF
tara:strand:+ start:357 stop:1547 length:1191 start_codon:yes stop_codon:yes gene_type:complete